MTRKRKRRPATDGSGVDPTALARQAGHFEAATGVAHGPGAVAVAVVAALLVVPLKRALSAIVRRIR